MMELFEEKDDLYTGPSLDDTMLRRAEETLGVRLPRTYVEVLFHRNGGLLQRRCCPTEFPASWATDHFEILALLGIGGEWGIDSPFGSAYLITEWGYPAIGVVLCAMPSGGHDAVMLDYSESGPEGVPAVAYIDEDRIPRRVANSFEEFLLRLVPCKASTS